METLDNDILITVTLSTPSRDIKIKIEDSASTTPCDNQVPLETELAALKSFVVEQFFLVKKSIKEIKDPNHEAANSNYVVMLMEQIEFLKEENKVKNSIIQWLTNQYNISNSAPTSNNNNNNNNNNNIGNNNNNLHKSNNNFHNTSTNNNINNSSNNDNNSFPSVKSACNNKNKDNNNTDTNINANNIENNNIIDTDKTKDSIDGTNVTIRRKKPNNNNNKNKYNNNNGNNNIFLSALEPKHKKLLSFI